MKTIKKATYFLTLLLLIAVTFGCAANDNESKAPVREKLTLKLHWIPDAHQLGFWAALDGGIYAGAGLDVTIYPGGLDANPIRDVVGGTAEIGQIGGIEQAITAASEGLPIKAIAALHRESPHALISLASNPVTTPEEFKGKTIAVAYGDAAELLLNGYIETENIDKESINFVPFRFDLSPLINGNVDAITGFSTGQPVTLEEQGKAPAVLEYSKSGIASYGYTLITSDKVLAERREAVAAFLEATRKGWEFAFAKPEEAIRHFKERFGDSVDEERAAKELALIKRLMLDQQGELASWELDEKRVAGVIDLLKKYGSLTSPADPSTIYDNGLVE